MTVAVALAALGAGGMGWSVAAAAPALWRQVWLPWWREEVSRTLDLGGRRGLARAPHFPFLVLALLAGLALAIGGPKAALLALVAAAATLPSLPTLLGVWIQLKVERADRQLVSLLPELGAGIRRDEALEALLDRLLDQVTRDRGLSDDARFSPLLTALFRDAAAASRLSPALLSVCDTFQQSPLPTARLVAQAWRQKPTGTDVPSSLRFIAEAVASDYAFQDEIRRKIAPVKAEAWLMIAMPVAMVLLLTRGDPAALRAMFTPPIVAGPIAAALLTGVSRVYLRSVLGGLR